ncbi:hypothetical protein LAZ67_9003847 [Cordylochernes scorpioides]|uniref:Ig-like domain-containing protein n=1 Tax=Cordylochernes scorpioides TaxID=51811 RepID=A0ABY6KUN8_9ARAC|nr:hypothetical protein LAZ67_9003847 [Cordylochernes scorpioides]
MIWIPNQLVGSPLGSDVTLDCILESHPKSVTYWTTKEGQMLMSNTKYDTVMLDSGLYKLQMRLQIKDLVPDDFGLYTCVAKNSLGETEGTIRLYGEHSILAVRADRINFTPMDSETCLLIFAYPPVQTDKSAPITPIIAINLR